MLNIYWKNKFLKIPKTPAYIGFGGLVPFVFVAIFIWLLDDPFKSFIFLNLINYCLLILSFLGAIHWGININSNFSKSQNIWYVWSIIPVLIPWISVMGIFEYTELILVFIISFLFSYLVDKKRHKLGVFPRWYLSLRKALTIGVVFSLLSVFIYLLQFKI